MAYQNKGDSGFLYLYLFAYVHPIKRTAETFYLLPMTICQIYTAAISQFQRSVAFHIEPTIFFILLISHLLSPAIQMTCFYLKRNTGRKCMKYFFLAFSYFNIQDLIY